MIRDNKRRFFCDKNMTKHERTGIKQAEYISEREPKRTRAFLGPPGTFTEEAAIKLTKDSNTVLVEANSIAEIFRLVQESVVTDAVVPIQNSTDGDIKNTIDGLLQNPNVSISGESIQDIRLYVYTAIGTSPSDIKRIVSKDTALRQSEKHMKELYPDIPPDNYIAINSTALGLPIVVENRDTAAVAGPHAAESLGLTDKVNRSEESVEDNDNNATTFVIISKSEKQPEPTGNDKTTFIMDVNDTPGNLYSVLIALKEKGINLNKIKNIKKDDGKMSFFVSIDGHKKDTQVKDALLGLNKLCPKLSVRGSYPKAKYTPRTTLRELDMPTAIERIKKEAQNGTNTENQAIVVFTLPNETGSLVNALEPFAQMDVNLTALDSQPSGLHDQYIFYLGYDKTTLTPEVQNHLLKELATRCEQMILLEEVV